MKACVASCSSALSPAHFSSSFFSLSSMVISDDSIDIYIQVVGFFFFFDNNWKLFLYFFITYRVPFIHLL